MLGLASVVWMGSVFVGNDSAALSVTAVIGGVYLIGVFELLRYRRATRGFTDALTAANEGVASLDGFISKLDFCFTLIMSPFIGIILTKA